MTKLRVYDINMQKIPELDSFDRRLLEEVRRDNQQPARVLADKVGLSVSAVLRRLRRLRDDGVIIADIAVVNPVLTGATLTLHVLVKMQSSHSRDVDAFSDMVAQQPEITAIWDITGEDDFLLKLQVNSMEEYDAFSRRFLREDNLVQSFKTMISIRKIIENEEYRRPLKI